MIMQTPYYHQVSVDELQKHPHDLSEDFYHICRKFYTQINTDAEVIL